MSLRETVINCIVRAIVRPKKKKKKNTGYKNIFRLSDTLDN